MDTCLHHLVERHARERPDAPAVVDGARTCTYAELDAWSNQVAHELVAQGVAPGDRVGLYLAKSIEAVVGVHAIMKAGATYVPLDPNAPVARLVTIAADAGIEVVVTGADRAATWLALAGSLPALRALVSLTDLNGEDHPEVVVRPGAVAARPTRFTRRAGHQS